MTIYNIINNVLRELQVSQNQILNVTINKTLRYHTETICNDLKLLFIKKLCYKKIVIFLKKHNMINPILHGHVALIPGMLKTIF